MPQDAFQQVTARPPSGAPFRVVTVQESLIQQEHTRCAWAEVDAGCTTVCLSVDADGAPIVSRLGWGVVAEEVGPHLRHGGKFFGWSIRISREGVRLEAFPPERVTTPPGTACARIDIDDPAEWRHGVEALIRALWIAEVARSPEVEASPWGEPPARVDRMEC